MQCCCVLYCCHALQFSINWYEHLQTGKIVTWWRCCYAARPNSLNIRHIRWRAWRRPSSGLYNVGGLWSQTNHKKFRLFSRCWDGATREPLNTTKVQNSTFFYINSLLYFIRSAINVRAIRLRSFCSLYLLVGLSNSSILVVKLLDSTQLVMSTSYMLNSLKL